jgi:hypothetical protein
MLCFFSRLLVLVGLWVVLDCLWIWADAHGFCLEGFGTVIGNGLAANARECTRIKVRFKI